MKPTAHKLPLFLAGFGLVVGLLALSLALQAEFPKPTGPYAVGRTTRLWVDHSRAEVLAAQPGQNRETPVIIWYPAKSGTGSPSAYMPDLAHLESDLAASGEVSPLEVFGLRFIRTHTLEDAQIADAQAAYPVVILSPGNGTNVEFYAGIAEELASYGYIVAGINHPYDVAAAALQNGTIARFVPGPDAMEDRPAWTAQRIAVRTQDVLFVLNQSEPVNRQGDAILSGHIDLNQAGVMGHSLGGITAAQACLADANILACLNFDGLQRGGPFSADSTPLPTHQPFMFMTKETSLPPASLALLQAIPGGSYVVTLPGASHDSFTDGPLLLPSLLPFPNAADGNLKLIRAYTLAFFDGTLKQQPSALLEKSMENEQVSVDKFPGRH